MAEKPTEPGYYWYRPQSAEYAEERWMIVDVQRDRTVQFPNGWSSPMVAVVDGEWEGPLKPPKKPSEKDLIGQVLGAAILSKYTPGCFKDMVADGGLKQRLEEMRRLGLVIEEPPVCTPHELEWIESRPVDPSIVVPPCSKPTGSTPAPSPANFVRQTPAKGRKLP